ncbi:MAG TPA: Fic family protein [bacterium]|nr:Fic family protein [bacterium]
MTTPVRYHLGKFPPRDLNWEPLIPLIGPANAALARFDGILATIPNPSVLLTPLFTQEAVLSSRIEGTQATMGEVLEFEAGAAPDRFTEDRKADIQEILNYRRAMNHALHLLNELPLCLRVIKEAHQTLMENVRGMDKSPGEFRKTPNWIGTPGCPIEEAKFIPVSADKLPESMSEWEKYLHDNVPDRLVQLAVLHAEFEALHPFLDGNGRLGRMLVPLFLFHAKLLKSPMFYISEYFERNRDAYYEKLLAVSRDGDWTGWCVYFLDAIVQQARINQQKASAILDLYSEKKDKLTQLTHSQYAIKALDFLFSRPIFSSTDFVKNAGIPAPTAKNFLRKLQQSNVLFQIIQSSGRRPSVFMFTKLLKITEGQVLF